MTQNQIADDLARNIHGTRTVTTDEIRTAVKKAFESAAPSSIAFARAAKLRPKLNAEKLLKSILERGEGFSEAELWEASPVRIDWASRRDPLELLGRLYAKNDNLFIGTRYDAGVEHVHTAAQWMEQFDCGYPVPEHIIPNPVTGLQGLTKDGNISFRADACIAQYKFAVVEFDTMPMKKQAEFWAGVKLPVVALIDSGGKSLHAWIRIDASSADEWTDRVEHQLFDILGPLGVDTACKNEARLSRMPGRYRPQSGRHQRLLYLNPDGGPIIP